MLAFIIPKKVNLSVPVDDPDLLGPGLAVERPLLVHLLPIIDVAHDLDADIVMRRRRESLESVGGTGAWESGRRGCMGAAEWGLYARWKTTLDSRAYVPVGRRVPL